MEVWELAAREQVRDLIIGYNRAGDRGRIDDLMALFAPSAVLSVNGTEHAGPDAIRAVFTRVTEPQPQRLRHFLTNLHVDISSPSEATAESYFQVFTNDGLDHWGRYRDTVVHDGDSWRFARRDVRVEGAVPGGWAAARLNVDHVAP